MLKAYGVAIEVGAGQAAIALLQACEGQRLSVVDIEATRLVFGTFLIFLIWVLQGTLYR